MSFEHTKEPTKSHEKTALLKSFVPVLLQAIGLKSYANKSDQLPADLAAYKYAKARWEGVDNGAYDKWILDRAFAPLNAHDALSA